MTPADIADDEEIVPRRRSLLRLIPALAMVVAMAAPAHAAPSGLIVRVCSGVPGEYVTTMLPTGGDEDKAPRRHDQAPCHAACPAGVREPRKAAG
jgi:hypothetical protein